MAMQRDAQPYRWQPLGLSDNRESTTTNPGDCRQLTNLIHDPSSKGVLAPRPGTVLISSFAGFSSPGVVSVHITVGTRIYGMIATNRTTGFDEPFCFDTATNGFITISGVTTGNVPQTQPSSGDWTPPTMALVGTKVVVTHPGFGATANKFGWFDISNPAAPAWSAGNTTGGIVLPTVPVCVGMFFNRAWYGMSNGVVNFSDSLNATVITNAGQSIQLDGTDAVKAIVPQPMTTGTQGILGALLIFKANSIWQIAGDYSSTTQPLSQNQLTASVGCSAGRTVVPTPMGTMFMSNDGVRTVSSTGNVSEPQEDVVFPFYNVNPASRACAAYSADVYRICLDTVSNQGSLGRFDYWFALRYQKWTGPHDFPYHCVSAINTQFVVTSNNNPGQLFLSRSYPSGQDSYTENGLAMTVKMVTSLINPDPPMSEKASVEMTFAFVPSVQTYNVQVLDANGNPLQSTTLVAGSPPASWGTGTWGIGKWTVSPYNMAISPLNFPAPLNFKTCVVVLTGAASLGLRLGHFTFRYASLGFTGKD